jgi:hypothetical protein
MALEKKVLRKVFGTKREDEEEEAGVYRTVSFITCTLRKNVISVIE